MQIWQSKGEIMKVNRVFCYSKDVAKQNGNRLPILELVLTTILLIVIMIVLALVVDYSLALIMITLFAFLGLTSSFPKD